MSSKNSKNRRSRPLDAPRRLTDTEILERIDRADVNNQTGDIWMMMISSSISGGAAEMLFILKLCEGGPLEDRYRWYENESEAKGVRMLHGLTEPKKIRFTWKTGAQIVRPMRAKR